jgi:hypothetical protein
VDKESQMDSAGPEFDGGDGGIDVDIWGSGSISDDFQSPQSSGLPKPIPPGSLNPGAAAPLEDPIPNQEELDLVLEERVV